MSIIAMAGARQINLSPIWAERLKKVHNPLCPGKAADNINIIRLLPVFLATPLSPTRGPPP